jgi:signal transduction histidine kinase
MRQVCALAHGHVVSRCRQLWAPEPRISPCSGQRRELLLNAPGLQQAALRDVNEALLLATLQAQDASSAARREHDLQAEFLHRLAHELRAPLSPLRNVVGLLAQARAGDTLPYVRDVIERQVSHLSQLVDDLLDTARLRTGKLSLRVARTELLDVLTASVQTCKPSVALRGQLLVIDLPLLPIAIHADPVRLTQIFSNLLSNASKYTPHGGRIALSVELQAGEVVISVADNGIGITPQAIDSIFEPYVQEPHAVRHDDSGLGLGLTLARELVLAHGGRIDVHSGGINCGTRFEVHLALAGPLTAEVEAQAKVAQ